MVGMIAEILFSIINESTKKYRNNSFKEMLEFFFCIKNELHKNNDTIEISFKKLTFPRRPFSLNPLFLRKKG